MSAYALWERGLRGPMFAVVQNRGDPPTLTERETRGKLGAPVALQAGDEKMALEVLMRLYPAPQSGGPSAERIAKIRALAEDDRGNPNERAAAAEKLGLLGGAA